MHESAILTMLDSHETFPSIPNKTVKKWGYDITMKQIFYLLWHFPKANPRNAIIKAGITTRQTHALYNTTPYKLIMQNAHVARPDG